MLTYNQIKEDAMEMGVDLSWALERRKVFLLSKIEFYEKKVTRLINMMAGRDFFNWHLILHWTGGYEKNIEELKKEIAFLKPFKGKLEDEITDSMIQRAKDSEIKNLLPYPVIRNLTNCVFHDDRNPSMSIKDNRVKCFSCGTSGDSIAVYMHLNNVGFKQAVLRLLNQKGKKDE